MANSLSPVKQSDIPPKKETDCIGTGNDWRQWCRLCAKEDPTGNINLSEPQSEDGKNTGARSRLVAVIFKHFDITIDDSATVFPANLCTDCYASLSSLELFIQRIAKVQQMFQLLQETPVMTNIELHAIREEFGLADQKTEQILFQQMSPEVHYLDEITKLSDCDEGTQKAATESENPLEQERVNCEAHTLLNEIDDNNVNEANITNRNNKIDESDKNDDDDIDDNGDNDDDDYDYNDDKISVIEYASGSDDDILSDKSSTTTTQSKQETDRRKRKTLVINKVPTDKAARAIYSFSCTECPRKFNRGDNFRRHMKRVHPDLSAQHKCSKCKLTFLTQDQLDKHMKVHESLMEKYVKCPYCSKKLRPNSLQKHINFLHVNKDERSFICEECGTAVRTKFGLKNHMLTHTDYAAFECEVCRRKFKKKFLLKKHMETHDPNKHICPECGRQLNSRATLNVHLALHAEKAIHKCEYCGRCFKQAKGLQYHLLLHTDLKPYSCEFCGLTFTHSYTWRAHRKKIHGKELADAGTKANVKNSKRNIPSLEALKSICRNIKSRKTACRLLTSSQNETISSNTINTSEDYDNYTFECDECKKRFKNKSGLKRHLETHDPSKHICPQCGQELNSRASLRQHLIIHSNKMQYTCEHCGRAFKRIREYKNHLIRHTGLKPFSCDFCDRVFTSSTSCRTHKRVKHSEELAAAQANTRRTTGNKTPQLEILKSIIMDADDVVQFT